MAANMAGLLPWTVSRRISKTIIISLDAGRDGFGSVLFRGFMAIIPILIGVLAGYALSFVMGVVDYPPRLPRRTGSRCQPSTPRALNGSPFSLFCLPRWW